ncbi:MAG: hypothetical protein JOZ83_04395 [Silvibacterium sp.]|nr:hypothetical protein [Silvibacterium sp.]
MPIRLRRNLEEIVLEDVERGPYRNVHEYLERAVTMLHAQERWLAAHREEIAARIEAELAPKERADLRIPQPLSKMVPEEYRHHAAD